MHMEYSASMQIGELTLVIERKAVQPAAVLPTPSSLDITIPPAGSQQNPRVGLDGDIPRSSGRALERPV